ncbi:hypothetical protein BH11PSE10_BH11PSE10_06320 [soil metagenome]
MLPQTETNFDEAGLGRGLPLLFNVVYCSRAAADVDAATVDKIIATSHRNNPRCGITGMLVFGEGFFFQWMEGSRASVMGMMDRIRCDKRHGQIVMLSEIEASSERLFPQWDMELVEAEDIRVVLLDALANDHQPNNINTLRAMLAELDARLGSRSPSA